MPVSIEAFQEPNGFIKVIIWILSLLAFALVSSDEEFECGNVTITSKFDDADHGEFFVFVFVVLWLKESALIVAYLVWLKQLLALPFNWWLLELSLTASWAFMALLASALFADEVADASDDIPDSCDGDFSQWETGIAFGFICMFVMLAACYYLYKEVKETGLNCAKPSTTTTTTTTTTAIDNTGSTVQISTTDTTVKV